MESSHTEATGRDSCQRGCGYTSCAAILAVPLTIFQRILGEVAERAIELDDDKLHELMIRLTLYSCADPAEPDYDPELVKKYTDVKLE